MPQAPARRHHQLILQPIGDETLVYDERSHKAYCLNRISAAVWLRCDGHHSVREIAELVASELAAPVTDEIVRFAISELQHDDLLLSSAAPLPGNEPMTTRRDLIRKLGFSAALLVPLITAVDAPRALAQSSANGGCVLPNTPILLADGSVLPASQVLAGQWLRSVDPVSGATRPGRVRSVHSFLAPRLHTLFTECGALLQASPSHLLISGFNDQDGRPFASFRVGDEVLISTDSGRVVPTRLSSITTIEQPQTVLGFEMDTWEHTLVTGGVVSHNVEPKMSSPTKPQR